jgi:2-oxoisovalerate dehydrogenase E1 component alpha subunit
VSDKEAAAPPEGADAAAVAALVAPVPEIIGGAEFVQLLTPEGERVDHPEYSQYIADLTDDDLRGFYRDQVLIRRFDAEATALQRQGELGLWASLLGQEAAQVGSGRALRPQDYAFPTYREHGVAWCRGVNPLNLLGMFRGVNHGGWDPNENNFHLYTVVIGAQALHAVGYAMGIQHDHAVGTGDPDRDAAVIAYFGDGASAQGDVNESFVYAASMNAPVVFFCQNNQWAISEPVRLQSHTSIAQRGQGYGIPGVQVDGNDVLAVLAATRLALARASAGQGPTLLEAVTYRMGPHTTSDDPTRYRSTSEDEEWRVKDPLARLSALLHAEGLVDDGFEQDVETEADAVAAALRAGCLSMPDPEPADLFAHVYVEPHTLVQEEKEAYAGYLAGFDEDS